MAIKIQKRMKSGAVDDIDSPIYEKNNNIFTWNKAVKKYYKLKTKSITQGLTPIESTDFAATKVSLNLKPDNPKVSNREMNTLIKLKYEDD